MKLLHKGKWANADVYRLEYDGKTMIYKGFDNRSFLVRWTIGVLLTRRETKKLLQLAEIEGIPGDVERCSKFAFRSDFIEGETLGMLYGKKEHVSIEYFLQAERLLKEMHKKGIVHLDLRRGTNWMIDAEGKPAIIDFQSALNIACLPRFLRRKLYEVDYSGLYKLWDKVCEAPLDDNRRKLLDRVNRSRKFWIFQGYVLQQRSKKKRRRAANR